MAKAEGTFRTVQLLAEGPRDYLVATDSRRYENILRKTGTDRRTDLDRKGRRFLSLFPGHRLPIAGVTPHPGIVRQFFLLRTVQRNIRTRGEKTDDPSDIVSLGEFDAQIYQTRFQIFLHTLLGVKANRINRAIFIHFQQLLNDPMIAFRLIDP